MGRSDAELLLAAQLDQAGIPYEREVRFSLTRRWRADFAVSPGHPFTDGTSLGFITDLLVEIDGGGFVGGRHGTGVGIEKDCEKASAAAILGYRVIRVTPKQVDDGRALEWIRAALNLNERSAA